VLRTGEAVDLIRESVRAVMQELIEAEASEVIGAGTLAATTPQPRQPPRHQAQDRQLGPQDAP
jgi:transposase-like protein